MDLSKSDRFVVGAFNRRIISIGGWMQIERVEIEVRQLASVERRQESGRGRINRTDAVSPLQRTILYSRFTKGASNERVCQARFSNGSKAEDRHFAMDQRRLFSSWRHDFGLCCSVRCCYCFSGADLPIRTSLMFPFQFLSLPSQLISSWTVANPPWSLT